MNNKNPFTQIELFFWNTAIRLLSNPSFTRFMLKKEITLDHFSVNTPLALLFVLTGAVGLLSGYLFYVLTVGVR